MKPRVIHFVLIIASFLLPTGVMKGQQPVKYSPSINYFKDLSDSYGGGNLLTGELSISRSWYGVNILFGHFQSKSTFLFKIPIEEINAILEIPVDEMSIMQVIAFSGMIKPIQRKWFNTDFLVGITFNNAKSLYLKGIDFSYNLDDKKLLYIIKDYQLYERNYFGYQFGINLSFYLTRQIGVQLSTRIQDLSKGGSFFFVGGGLCFKL